MAFNIESFRSHFNGDGARANLFEVALTFPTIVNNAAAAEKLTFTARAAHLPGSTVGVVPLMYFGREIKLAGNRTFPEWTITVMNDEDFVVRDAFERWQQLINSNRGNFRDPAFANDTAFGFDYTTQAEVRQFSKFGNDPGGRGNILKYYLFVGLWPTDISTIDLDWSTNDSIEEFSVTFQYQYWLSNTTSPTE